MINKNLIEITVKDNTTKFLHDLKLKLDNLCKVGIPVTYEVLNKLEVVKYEK